MVAPTFMEALVTRDPLRVRVTMGTVTPTELDDVIADIRLLREKLKLSPATFEFVE